MKKYEYTWYDDSFTNVNAKPLAIMLDEMGKEGWELCSAFAFSSFSRYFFKREIKE